MAARYSYQVSVDQIKNNLAALSPDEQREVAAFLFHLRHASDSEYQQRVDARLSDPEPTHWLTPEQFERQLGGE